MDSISSLRHVHMVGSVPLPDTRSVFNTLAQGLPQGRLKRIPDGETAERQQFTRFQMAVFAKCPWIAKPMAGATGDQSQSVDRVAARIDDALQDLATVKDEPDDKTGQAEESVQTRQIVLNGTGYDVAAINSYKVFRELKSQNVVERDARFQVSLPMACSAISWFVRSDLMAEVEPLYNGKLLEALDKIQEHIPAEELAIQWDVPAEMAMIELFSPEMFDPWFARGQSSEVIRTEIVSRVVRHARHVKEGVEMGFHCCYGDMAHKHFLEPKDVSKMVGFVNEIANNVTRLIDWVHMPVPKERLDREYFEALKDLKLDGKTEVYLGLVHKDDLEGTKDRIKAAQEFLPQFGIATECGLGRASEEELHNVLEISRLLTHA